MNTVSPLTDAAKVVLILIRDIKFDISIADSEENIADPPLNPYHPNHNIKLPNATKPTLCGLNSSFTIGLFI